MKKGQVWVETVIYVLIGLSIIGLVLAFVSPRIAEQKDRIIIDQTIVSLREFDSKINEVIESGQDNRRIIEFGMKAGELYFDAVNNKIVFVLNGLEKPYSESGIKVPVGRIIVESNEGKKTSTVNLTLIYSNIDLTFQGTQNIKKFNPSAVPYSFSIENKGTVSAGVTGIDISEG